MGRSEVDVLVAARVDVDVRARVGVAAVAALVEREVVEVVAACAAVAPCATGATGTGAARGVTTVGARRPSGRVADGDLGVVVLLLVDLLGVVARGGVDGVLAAAEVVVPAADRGGAAADADRAAVVGVDVAGVAHVAVAVLQHVLVARGGLVVVAL